MGEDAEHRCRIQEKALERIAADFAHLLLLVERAVVDDAKSGIAEVGGGVDFAGLLQRLRSVGTASPQGPCASDGSVGTAAADIAPVSPARDLEHLWSDMGDEHACIESKSPC